MTPVAVTVTPLPLESANGRAPFAAFSNSVVPAMGGSARDGGVNAAADATTRKPYIEPLSALNVESPPMVNGAELDDEKL